MTSLGTPHPPGVALEHKGVKKMHHGNGKPSVTWLIVYQRTKNLVADTDKLQRI